MLDPYFTLAKRLISQFVIVFLLEQQFLLSHAWAQDLPIVVDGSTNTQVTHTASGIDQVNIAAPNESGLSHNKFSEYNVNQAGQIINNFSGRNPAEILVGSGETAVTQTQIGGLVAANPNLVGSGSARVILNEVTSGSVSQLLGYVEIAGTKADLILANPNGIACSGCGFINTAKLVMVAGSTNYDDRGNLGFNLKEQANPNLYVPLITVSGLGLDAANVTSAEIVASSVKLLSTIYGSEDNSLTIRTGEGRYDYATKNINSSSADAKKDHLGSFSPVFAIDASALAKIQAGRIYLIATKQGVGVKMESEILASSTLNIDANGDVYYKNIAVGDAADLKSTAKIQSIDETSSISAPNLTIQANELRNSGDISAKNLTIQNSATLKNNGNLAALNLVISNVNQINNNSTIYGENSLSISGGNLTNSTLGTIYSLNDYTINLSSIVDSGILTNSGLITSEKKLTINANQLNNSSEISAKGNFTLDITGSVSNSGNIISNNILNLTSDSLTNSNNISGDSINATVKYTLQNDGLIFSSRDSFLKANSLINDGNIISDKGNLGLDAASFNNGGNIYSDLDLDVVANEITNSNDIQSGGKIILTVGNMANSNKIISTQDFEINASGDVVNSSVLKSGADFKINAASFSNAALALILAQNNLTLHATDINNQNTKPSEKTINSGIVAVDGNVSIKTDSLNNNSGMITAKSTSVSALNALSVNLANTRGVFINTDVIHVNLGDAGYTITGTLTASNVDISATSIVNLGDVTASDYIKLNATAGNVTNGSASGDNTNVRLAAGSYVELSASNNINNYGAIVATTDLTLTATSGDVNNYSGAKIQGGSGAVTVNAVSGSFNNIASTSLLTSDNNAIFNVRDLNNSGEISVANDLTANVSHDFGNNATALIWANNDAKFYVVNNFVNTLADIYAGNDLVIQKNLAGDKTALVQNISGRVETLQGDITINATTFQNKRTADPVTKYLAIPNAYTDSVMPNWVYQTSWCQGNNCENWYYVYYGSNALNSNSISAQIFSGNNLTLNSSSFTNNMSEIYSVGDMSITYQTDFTNNSTNSLVGNLEYLYVHAWDRLYHEFYDLNRNVGINDLANYTFTFPGYIKSGGAMTITQSGTASATFSNSGTTMQHTTVGSIAAQSHSTNIGHLDTYTLSETGIVSLDLTAISSVIENAQALDPDSPTAPTYSGAFKINLDPAATVPLLEARSQFTDASSFYGSAYYWTALGLDADVVMSELERQTRITNLRMLGDSFVETRLILEKLKAMTNNSLFLSRTTIDPNQQIKELLDNANTELARLGLNAADIAINGLSKEQTNALTRDIITFEISEVQGFKVLAPKIYLSQSTRNSLLNQNSVTGSLGLATNSTIFAKGNLTVNATDSDLVNNGSIASARNVNLTLNSLMNRTNAVTQAQIMAGNNLTISSVGNIKNLGANIGAVGNVSLTSVSGSILNSAIVATNDRDLLTANSDSYVANGFAQRSISNTAGFGAGEISSQLLSNAAIKGGAVAITAANDFTNLAATVSATQNSLTGGGTSSGNVAISAGDDITVSTLELRNRTERSWGNRRRGGTEVNDVTTNVSSEISAAGNISLASTGLGTDAEGVAALALYNQKQSEIDPLQTQLSALQAQLSALQIALGTNSLKNPEIRNLTSQINNLQSQINAINDNYNLQLAPLVAGIGSNVNITGSNLSAANDINILSTNNTNILNAVNLNYHDFNSHKKGSVKTSNSVQTDYVETAVNSNLSATNINITSGDNILIQSSDLNSSNNQSLTAENVTIQDAKLSEFHYAATSRNYNGVAKVGANLTSTTIGAVSGIINLTYNIANAVLTPMQKAMKHDIFIPTALNNKVDDLLDKDRDFIHGFNNALTDNSLYNIKHKTFETNIRTNISSSNLVSQHNVNIASDNNTVIQASNISAANDLQIDAENLYILADQETNLTNNEDKRTRTLMFRNNNNGVMETQTINSELSAGNFEFNVINNITTSYNSSSFNSSTGIVSGNASGLEYLTYLKENKDNVIYNPTSDIAKSWDQTARGLTDAGTAVVAVAATVATVATAGALAPVAAAAATTGFVVGTAIASSAAVTVSVSATNSSMNAQGDFFKQAKDIGHTALKDVASEESLRNMAIAGLTAGAVKGISVLAEGSKVANGANGVNSANNAGSLPNINSNYTSLSYDPSSFTNNLSSGTSIASNGGSFGYNATMLSSRFLNALQNSTIQTVANSAAQSAVNGDDFGQALRRSLLNIVINAAGEVAANGIGYAAKTGQITTTQQLTLHAGLGCAMGAAQNGNCAAGAAGAVLAEGSAQLLESQFDSYDRKFNGNVGKAIGTLGGLAIGGPDNGDAVYAANNTANNAVENNYQEDVHYDLTKYLAEKAGLPEEYARAIADGDQGTDDNNITEPFSSVQARREYHFTTEQQRDKMKQIAYETNDIRLFGEYLHALQDSYAHTLFNIPFEEVFGHIYATSLVDKTYMRPAMADKMALNTYVEIQNFVKHLNIVPNYSSSWSEIKYSVQAFNRSFTLEGKYYALQK